jgi:bifunctional pyridoxal-dependent enzyme with beta-cystathionase and maltose regulon repressor activities
MLLSTGVHNGVISTAPDIFAAREQNPAFDTFLGRPLFCGDISYVGCTPEESPMKLVNGCYSIDYQDFERRISHGRNVLILCNPHNPTGHCWWREDVTKIGEICTQRRVVVPGDEIHCDFVPYSALADWRHLSEPYCVQVRE